METTHRQGRLPLLMLGTAFIAFGVLLILDNIGIFGWSVWKLWPLGIVLPGIVRLIQSDDSHGRRLGVWCLPAGRRGSFLGHGCRCQHSGSSD